MPNKWLAYPLLKDGKQHCTACDLPVSLDPDWTLWPWPDGANLCSRCNDARHEVDEYDEVGTE